MWFHIFNQNLHHMLVKWVGKATCDGAAFAGIGTACRGVEATNMGMVTLALLALVVTAALLNVRRRRRRAEYFW